MPMVIQTLVDVVTLVIKNLFHSQNIVINGVVMNGNCYTYPLILPEIDFKDPENDGEVILQQLC